MNSLGKSLSLADLVRNYLLLGMAASKQEKLYKAYWLPMEKRLPKKISDFIRDYLIACSDTKPNDREENRLCGVHFFVDDYRFSGIFDNPDRTFSKYAQYAFLLSPDFSLYADMDLWRQMESVAKNRWCGAYWQSRGQTRRFHS